MMDVLKLLVFGFLVASVLGTPVNSPQFHTLVQTNHQDSSNTPPEWTGSISLGANSYHQGAGIFSPATRDVRAVSFWAKIPSAQKSLHSTKYIFDMRPDYPMYLSSKSSIESMGNAKLLVNGQSADATFDSIKLDEWCHIIITFEEPVTSSFHFFERYNHQQFMAVEVTSICMWSSPPTFTAASRAIPEEPTLLSRFPCNNHSDIIESKDGVSRHIEIPSTNKNVQALQVTQYDCDDCIEFHSDTPKASAYVTTELMMPKSVLNLDDLRLKQLQLAFSSMARVTPELVGVFSRYEAGVRRVVVRLTVDPSFAHGAARALKHSLSKQDILERFKSFEINEPFVDWISGPVTTTVTTPFSGTTTQSPDTSLMTKFPSGLTHHNSPNTVDSNGCLLGQGFSWCSTTQECVQDWENGIDGPCPVCYGGTVWCDAWDRCVEKSHPCANGDKKKKRVHQPPVRLGQDDSHNCMGRHSLGGFGWSYCPGTRRCIQNWPGGFEYPCPTLNDTVAIQAAASLELADSEDGSAEETPVATPGPVNIKRGASVKMGSLTIKISDLPFNEYGELIGRAVCKSIASKLMISPNDLFVYSSNAVGESTVLVIRVIVRPTSGPEELLNTLSQISLTDVTTILKRTTAMIGWDGFLSKPTTPTIAQGQWSVPVIPLSAATTVGTERSQSPSHSLSGSPSASPSASVSTWPSHSPTPSPSSVLVGGTVTLAIAIDGVTPQEFHPFAPELKEVVAKIVTDATFGHIASLYGVSNTTKIRSYVNPKVMIIQVEGMTDMGAKVDVFPDNTPGDLISKTFVTLAIPVISDSFMDGNNVADGILLAIKRGSILSRMPMWRKGGSTTIVTHVAPRWETFESTEYVASIHTDLDMSGTNAGQLKSNPEVTEAVLSSFASKLGCPRSWVSFQGEMSTLSQSATATLKVEVPIDAIARYELEVASKLDSDIFLLEVSQELKLKSFTIQFITTSTSKITYGLRPAHELGQRSVFVSGTSEEPYVVNVQVPESFTVGRVRGVPLPMRHDYTPRVYDVQVTVTRGVQIELTPMRPNELTEDMFV